MKKTLRLVIPQWQGGNTGIYPLGARLLDWLAPACDHPTIEVPIEGFVQPQEEPENGIFNRDALCRQTNATMRILEEHDPERIIILGGDCSVEQAPFAFLNKRYGGKVGILWIDAHPDVADPSRRQTGHTMVLRNLLGRGDAMMSEGIDVPFDGSRVACAGLTGTFGYEDAFLEEAAIVRLSAGNEIPQVRDWIEKAGIEHLAIHLDVDVFHPRVFRDTMFAKPENGPTYDNPRQGAMTFEQVAKLIDVAAANTTVVALGITEFMPWDALALQNLMSNLPLFKE